MAQSLEPILVDGEVLPSFGIVYSVGPRAVNDAGEWIADYYAVPTSGIAVNGALAVAYGSVIPGGGTILEEEGVAINGQGEYAYGAELSPNASDFAVVARGSQVLRTGDATGVAGVEWLRTRVEGFTDNGRVVVAGLARNTATQDELYALGYVDLDLAGNVTARGMIALEGQALPGSLGLFSGPVRTVTVSANGHVMWVGNRAGVPASMDQFLLLDDTVLAVEGTPSPNAGLRWRLGVADLGLSPSGNHWCVSGVMSGNEALPDTSALIVDGVLRYGPGMVLPAFAPHELRATREAAIDDNGVVTWRATVDGLDYQARDRWMLETDVLWHSRVDVVGGQRYWSVKAARSPTGRYSLHDIQADEMTGLLMVDAAGPLLACGSITDPFEPNDSCAEATVVDPTVLMPYPNLPTADVRRGVDEDWYSVELPPGQVLTVQARHAAIGSEVDLEIYTGACVFPITRGRTFQAAEDEGLHYENTGSSQITVWVRVFVPDRSPSDCAEYRLAVERHPGNVCLPGPGPDYLEPNSSCAAPRPILDGFYPGITVSQVDPDYYVVAVPPGGSVTYTVSATGTDPFTISLQSEDCTGEWIAFGVGNNASVAFTNQTNATQSAILKVSLSQMFGQACRPYSLTVEEQGSLVGNQTCISLPNSTGEPAITAAVGSLFVPDNQLGLRVGALPVGSTGYFLASTQSDFVTNPGGSQGILCLGGSIGRIFDSVSVATSAGQAAWNLDLASIPQPSSTTAVLPGSTWFFQYWYRDMNPGATSNFSSGHQVSFQ